MTTRWFLPMLTFASKRVQTRVEKRGAYRVLRE